MQKLLQSGNARLYFYLGSLVVMAGLWRVGDAITAELGNLPVKMAPSATVATTRVDQKSYPAVWIKKVAANPSVAEGTQLDSLFNSEKHLEAKAKAKANVGGAESRTGAAAAGAPAAVENDYASIFMQAVHINGVADDGMFLNGRFYPVGAKLEAFAMAGQSGQMIVPQLVSLTDGRATFDVAGKSVTARIKE